MASPPLIFRALLFPCLLFQPGQATAAIIGSCTIVVGAPGTLTVNSGITVLGSQQAGGSAAGVTVTPNSVLCSVLNLLDCFSISSPAPASFLTAPTAGGTNVTFATAFRLNGGPQHPGNTPLRVANGSYSMAVDLTAARTNGVFTVGFYQSQVTVRCE